MKGTIFIFILLSFNILISYQKNNNLRTIYEESPKLMKYTKKVVDVSLYDGKLKT